LNYIVLFLAGLVIEIGVFSHLLEPDMGHGDFITSIAAINVVTHPLLIYVLHVFNLPYLQAMIGSEIAIIVVEGYLLGIMVADVSLRRVLFLSLLANLASWQLTPFILFVVSVL